MFWYIPDDTARMTYDEILLYSSGQRNLVMKGGLAEDKNDFFSSFKKMKDTEYLVTSSHSY